MGESILEPAAFIVDKTGNLAQLVEPILRIYKIPFEHYFNIFQLLANSAKHAQTTPPMLFITPLSELATEEFHAVSILKKRYEKASFICMDHHSANGSLEIVLKAGKLGLEIATDLTTLVAIVNSAAMKLSVKTGGNNTDRVMISSFEQRINSIAGNFFLTDPKTMQKSTNG